MDFTVTMFNYTSGELHFVWYQPLLTNGIITEYMLQCIPEVPGLPNCEKRINSALYLAGQHFTAVLSCLKRGVTYNCSLQASNDAGYGPASHMIFAEGVLITTLEYNYVVISLCMTLRIIKGLRTSVD